MSKEKIRQFVMQIKDGKGSDAIKSVNDIITSKVNDYKKNIIKTYDNNNQLPTIK